jgi:hypothetical protein
MRVITRLALALCLLGLGASASDAAFTVINSVSAGAVAGANVTTGSVNMNGADLIVCGTASYNGATIVTVSDSHSNTYSYRTTYNDSDGDSFLRIAYVQGAGVGTSGMTFTSSSSGTSYSSIACLGVSGSLASPYDVENGATALSSITSLQPGSVTPSVTDDLFVTVIDDQFGNGTFSINSGFTIDQSVATSNTNHIGIALAHKIKTDALAENPTWSWPNATTGVNVTQAAFLKGAGGSPPATPCSRTLLGAGC